MNFFGGFGNFLNAMPAISNLGFTPNMPVPNFGNGTQLNSMFATALGPEGLMGLGPANATIAAGFSGTVGSDLTAGIQARVPQYRTVFDQKPIYAYDTFKAEDYHFQQGTTTNHVAVASSTQTRFIDPVIIDLDGDGKLGVTGRTNTSEIIADSTAVATSVSQQGRRIDTTTTSTRSWTTRDNWNDKIDFDVNADGNVDRTEWLKTGTGDAFLVTDLNNDGQINGRELMNETGINGEQNKYKGGWDKARDLFDANKDGVLEGNELSNLKVWNDKNGDGRVDSGEMKSLSEAGIVKIDTNDGTVTRQRLTGYQSVPRQEVSGYVELNSFANTGGSNIGMNFTPVGSSSPGPLSGIDIFSTGGVPDMQALWQFAANYRSFTPVAQRPIFA
ncbi:MAG: hypothetical protein FJX76_03505 [Armatimonadetes bacterium]|nr:hypothetical protein [Armatimonadota bacterium]